MSNELVLGYWCAALIPFWQFVFSDVTVIVELPTNPWSMQVWALGCGGMSCEKNRQAVGLPHYRLQLYYCRHLKCFNAHISVTSAKILCLCKGPPPTFPEIEWRWNWKPGLVFKGEFLRRVFKPCFHFFLIFWQWAYCLSVWAVILFHFRLLFSRVLYTLSNDEIGFSVEPCPGSNDRSLLLKC